MVFAAAESMSATNSALAGGAALIASAFALSTADRWLLPVLTVAHGALLAHVTGGAEAATFQPMNCNFGLFPPLAEDSDVDAKGATLTEREKEIAVLLAKSYSSKEVAVKLDISAKTVENHRTNLMRKLGVHDVAGVIRFVVRQGFYDPSDG